MAIASDVSALLPGPDNRDAASAYGPHVEKSRGADYHAPALPNAASSFPDYAFIPDTDASMHTTPAPNPVHDPMKAVQATLTDISHAARMGQPSAPLHLAPPALYTSASLTRSNPPESVSPLQARFDSHSLSNGYGSTDSNMRSAASSSFEPRNETLDRSSVSFHRHRSTTSHSTASHPDGASPPTPRRATGRRRKSENVEPGSARAVYLEKNRKAASKCRTKQKMQQEELVETAREFERKNKALKAEVEFLKADMRDLMELVGKHTACPDTRLQTYIQHEADRLAARDKHSMVAQLLSPTSSASPEKA